MRQAGRYLPGQGQGLGVLGKTLESEKFWRGRKALGGSLRLSLALPFLSAEFRGFGLPGLFQHLSLPSLL